MARKKGITYASVHSLDDAALQKLFFPDRSEGSDMYELPDYKSIHEVNIPRKGSTAFSDRRYIYRGIFSNS